MIGQSLKNLRKKQDSEEEKRVLLSFIKEQKALNRINEEK